MINNSLTNGFYDPGNIDVTIENLDYCIEHPILFGHSDQLSSKGLGYWVNVITIKTSIYPQASQIAVGGSGMASRYKDHGSSTWGEWYIYDKL